MKSFEYQGFKFLVFEDVYDPSDDTFLLAENMDVSKNDYVLDMGTGCGILAVIAGKIAKKVVGVDISQRAIMNARVNISLNKVEARVEARLGDLWDVLKPNEIFSLILFNPPYLPITETEKTGSILERAWDGGENGRAVINLFLARLDDFLREEGRVQMVLSSLSKIGDTLSYVKKKQFDVEIKVEKNFFFEKLVLINLKKV
jgi:release factor glutamine methyltransferase